MPSVEELMDEVRARKAASPSYIGTATILRHRDADRK